MANLFDINLNRLVVFVAVVETGSITAAAKRLGLAKTMVSAHMQKLEAEMSSNLLVRTTRRLHLTEAGQLFYEACQKILKDTEAAIALAGGNTQQMRGKLRISAPIDYAANVIAPIAAQLTAVHPDLRIEILASDNRVDMVAEGIDLAIRIGRLVDSTHKAVLIDYFEEWLVAPPHIFTDGIPTSPQEVARFPLVGFSVLANPLVWTFVKGEEAETIRFQSRMMANSSASVKAAVFAGAGLAVHANFAVQDEVESGRLIRLLSDWKLPRGGIYGVFPASSQRSHKVSLFIDAIRSAQKHATVGSAVAT